MTDIDTAPAETVEPTPKRARGRPRKPVVISEPKTRGRPKMDNTTYRNPEALKAYKRDLYEARGFLIHKIRKLAIKNGTIDTIEYARKPPAVLFEILRTMLVQAFNEQQTLIDAGSRDAIVRRRTRTRTADV